MTFKTQNPEKLQENVFTLTGKDWFLITAGTQESFNSMTAGWGGMGILWNKHVCFIYVRPTRYTYEFLEKHDFFTLCFFEEKYKKILSYCGSHSGRDVDKIRETGLTPLVTEKGSVYFEEARLVFECRKIYFQDLNAGAFLDPAIERNYPLKDYHRLYVGEIVQCLGK